MADRLVDGQPEVRRIEHEVVLADLHRLGGELLCRFLAPLAGVADEVAVEHILPAAAHGRGLDTLTALEVGEVGGDGRGREQRPAAHELLVGEGAIGAGKEAILLHEEEHRVHEAHALHLERLGVGLEQEVDLLLERHLEGIGGECALPDTVRHGGRAGELDGPVAGDAIGPGDGRGLAGGAGDGIAGEEACADEAPAAVDEHPHAAAERVGVDHVDDLLLARDDEVLAIAPDARIRVRGAGAPGGVERHHQQFLAGAFLVAGQAGSVGGGFGMQLARPGRHHGQCSS